MKTACEQCPWRKSNHGKRHKHGFYTEANLRRLWGQIRRGGSAQSCHLTDPSHPDHIEAGAPKNGKAKECPGSVVLVMREFDQLSNDENHVDVESIDRYHANRKTGLTKKGILYWLVNRYQLGKTPLGQGALPEVDACDEEIGLPEELLT